MSILPLIDSYSTASQQSEKGKKSYYETPIRSYTSYRLLFTQ